MSPRAARVREHWENERLRTHFRRLWLNDYAPPSPCAEPQVVEGLCSWTSCGDCRGNLAWPLCTGIAGPTRLSVQRDRLGLPDPPRRPQRRRDGLGLRFFILESLELDRVVGAEQLDVADRQPREFAQPGQVRPPRGIVGADETLERTQARGRNAAAGLDLGTVEIGVAAMEEPILRPAHRDAAMAARMPRQRDQENLVPCSGNCAHRRKAEPVLSVLL